MVYYPNKCPIESNPIRKSLSFTERTISISDYRPQPESRISYWPSADIQVQPFSPSNSP